MKITKIIKEDKLVSIDSEIDYCTLNQAIKNLFELKNNLSKNPEYLKYDYSEYIIRKTSIPYEEGCEFVVFGIRNENEQEKIFREKEQERREENERLNYLKLKEKYEKPKPNSKKK